MPDIPFNDVTIVCITYQSRALVDTLADTLRPYPKVIVVDNASTDGTAAATRARLPHANVIENTHNAGYGQACNLALAGVRTPYALLVNPDCEIAPETLATLRATLERYPSAGMVAPQSLFRDLRPRKSYRPAFHLRLKDRTYRVPEATCSAQWIHGCCQLMRVGSFQRVGGFDKRFFLFFEDDDLCLRMQEAGYDCLLEPAARIVHTGGASSALNLHNRFHRSFHYVRSKHLITRKYLGKRAARQYLLKIALACLPAVLAYSLLLRRKYVVKWLAWGSAAVSCAFDRARLPLDGESARTPGHITH